MSASPVIAHDVEVLDLDLIDPHPRNPRRDLGDLTELTASIKADGVRNALHVMVSPDGERYVVVQGHRRREAALLAGQTVVPAVIRTDLKTDADALVEVLVENLLRADLTPIEEATAYEQLQLAGVKPATIAKRTGRKRATVDARLALMTLPEQARDAVHGAQLSLDDAAALVEFADDPKAVETLTRLAGTSNFRWELQNARNRRDRARRAEETKAALAAAGVTLVDKPNDWWGRALSNVLGDTVPGITRETEHDEAREARRAWHAERCEHHVAWIDHDGTAAYGCSNPTVHRHHDGTVDEDEIRDASLAGDVAGSGSSAAADRQAMLEREQKDRDDCLTAAGIRRAFITERCNRTVALTPDEEDRIARVFAGFAVEYYLECDPVAAAGYLGVELTEEQTDDAEAAAKAVQAILPKRPGAVGLLAALAADSGTEDYLSRAGNWHAWQLGNHTDTASRRWLSLLVALGYELTEWEAGKVAAADQRAAEQAAAAAAEEAAGDEDDQTPIEDVVQDL